MAHMITRPTSVSVISWFLIVISIISLISTTMMIGNPTVTQLMEKTPLPIPIQYAMSYLGLSIMLISGIFMLKGLDWARKLYVGWTTFGLLIGIATSPMKATLIPGTVMFIVIVFFLFRPKANAYFSPSESEENA
jgi:hypothetical protein